MPDRNDGPRDARRSAGDADDPEEHDLAEHDPEEHDPEEHDPDEPGGADDAEDSEAEDADDSAEADDADDTDEDDADDAADGDNADGDEDDAEEHGARADDVTTAHVAITQAVRAKDRPTRTVTPSEPDALPRRPGTRGRHARPKATWWRSPWVIAIAAVAVLLAGAGIALALSATHGPVAASPGTVGSTTPSHGPACPLTGAPASGNSVPSRPAMAVKVDNYPDARPQSGLDKADVVFEEPVEGGITRFVAVFQCQDAPAVGPIRSARYPDVGIVDELSDPLFFHVGGIDPILSLIHSAHAMDQNLIYADSSIVQHPSGRYAPYDTYISTQDGWGTTPKATTPPTPIFQYANAVPPGVATTGAHIPFSPQSDETWTWDPHGKSWQLAYSGNAATLGDGNQISPTNVVIETVQITYGPWLENESASSNEVEVHPTGSGPLTVLRNGEAITGTWNRSSLNQPATLTASDGTAISLAPGQTWVDLVPSGISVTTTPATPSSSSRSG